MIIETLFAKFLSSTVGFCCAIGLFVSLLLAFLTKRIRSPFLSLFFIFLMIFLILYISMWIWLFITWGQPHYIRWKHPVHKVKPNRGLFDV